MDIGDKKVLLISFAKTFFTAQEELSFGLKSGCPQKSNIRRPRRKNRFCSNFAQIYLIISENAPYIFLGQMLF